MKDEAERLHNVRQDLGAASTDSEKRDLLDSEGLDNVRQLDQRINELQEFARNLQKPDMEELHGGDAGGGAAWMYYSRRLKPTEGSKKAKTTN
jgi:hypothetical protein